MTWSDVVCGTLLLTSLFRRGADAQTDGDVRLVNGTKFSEGRVEIFHSGRWGTVCANSWSYAQAEVTCRQLGLTGGRGYRNARFGEGAGLIWASSLRCSGLEARLTQCRSSETDWWTPDDACTHAQDAGVVCDVPNEGSLRLVGGNAFSGRLEIFSARAWFSVCRRGWADADAHVACRQLGMEPGKAGTDAARAPDDARMLLIDVDCSGNERNLNECTLPRTTSGNNCTADQAATVICTEPSESAVRLANGDVHFGRVEVFHQGEFGTVCDDQWTDAAARVVCRQLDLLGGVAHGRSHHGQGSGQIWLKDIQCAGTEASLAQCRGGVSTGSQINSCFHYEDSSVTCEEPADGALRLVNGSSGRVEVYRHHTWGSLCAYEFSAQGAAVVCRQLGSYGGTVTSEPAPPDGVVVWATSVQCAGDEAALSDCPAQWSNTYLGYDVHECTGGAYVGVACQNTLQRRPKVADAFDGNLDQEQGAGEAVPAALPTDAPVETVPLVVSGNGSLVVTPVGLLTINPELRLLLESAPVRIMGSTPYTGQVEVFVEDRWTAICDSYWNDEDASVVCRQMGFSGGQASGHSPTDLEALIRGVGCDGHETRLSDCALYSSHQCSGGVSVTCVGPEEGVAGAVRIVGGMFASGQVEIFLSGRWGSICAGGHWDGRAARVVCRELGFVDGKATATDPAEIPADGTVYQISEPILASINCSGTESRLYECQDVAYVTDAAALPPAPIAGVQCVLPEDGSLRLRGGGREGRSGRLELYHNHQWGTVCSRGWDDQAALVVCTQLGFRRGEARYAAHFGSGAGPVHVTHVSCLGSETHIHDCYLTFASEEPNVELCGHSSDVGVYCSDDSADDKDVKNRIVGVLVACIVVLLFALMFVAVCVYAKMKSYAKYSRKISPDAKEVEKEGDDVPPSYTTVALESAREPTQTAVEQFEPGTPMLTPRTLETLRVTPPPRPLGANPPPPPVYHDLYPKRSNTVM